MSILEGEFNPYAAPVADPEFAPLAGVEDAVGAWREGALLVMTDGAVLPDRCFQCNAGARGYRLRRNLVWHPPAYYLLMLVSPLVYLVVALIVRQKVTVFVPLCERHRGRRVRAIALGWLLAVVGLISMVGIPLAASAPTGPPNDRAAVAGILGGVALLVTGVISGLVTARVVVTKKIKDRFAWVDKGHPDFLASLPTPP